MCYNIYVSTQVLGDNLKLLRRFMEGQRRNLEIEED